jgi:hypothetical protein
MISPAYLYVHLEHDAVGEDAHDAYALFFTKRTQTRRVVRAPLFTELPRRVLLGNSEDAKT